jgi:hypothetical protein
VVSNKLERNNNYNNDDNSNNNNNSSTKNNNLSKNRNKNKNNNSNSNSNSNSNKKKAEPMAYNFTKMKSTRDDNGSDAGSSTLSKQYSVDSLLQFPPSGAQMQEKRFRDMIKALKNQLEEANHQVRCFRAHEVERAASKAELEIFFNQSVDDVKRDISRRRNKVMRSTHSRVLSKELARATTVGFDKFTTTDRRRVLELLLSSDRVLSVLHEAMFVSSEAPHTSATHARHNMAKSTVDSSSDGSLIREVDRPDSEMEMRSPAARDRIAVVETDLSMLMPLSHATLPEVSPTRPPRT